jgi:sulfatase maturation enzyme AslB (radical SAM superfamily)
MEKQIIGIENTNNYLYVYWVITDFCNQACSYCHESLHNGYYYKHPKFTPKDFINFAHKLVELSKTTNRKILLDIAGGEPTVYEQLPEIIELLAPYSIISIITNGTRNISWWSSLPVLPNKVVITLHPEYYDNKKIRVNDLADFLTEKSINFQFNLMCLPDRWNQVMMIYNDIEEGYRSLIIPKIIQDQGREARPLYLYSNDQLAFIKEKHPKSIKGLQNIKPAFVHYSDSSKEVLKSNVLMAQNKHYFKRWACSAGSAGISVWPSGIVNAGICSTTNLGDIINFKLLDEYLLCNRTSCVCPADIALDKYKIID